MNKDQILKAWKSLPIKTLQGFIMDGAISVADLEGDVSVDTDSKSRERLDQLKKSLKDKDKELWNKALKDDTVESYREYINFFGENGIHKTDAKEAIDNKDTELWQMLQQNPTEANIEKYRSSFPDGLFARECEKLAEDLPWYKTKAKNTIRAYEEYQRMFPHKHEDELKRRISDIEDNRDWETACNNGSSEAYDAYKKKHPDGKYCEEATNRINNRSGRDLLLDELRQDINKYPVEGDDHKEGIKEKIENNVATWDDLKTIFSEQQVDAIRNYIAPKQLPIVKDFEKLPRGYTEVYFWGTRGTGKTCAIGATIGYLQNIRRSINPIKCPGERYLHQLQNLFRNDGNVCSLPPGTVTGNLPAMAFSFKDKRDADHRTMLIDVAGEVFAGIFKAEHNLPVSKDEQDAIDHLKECLNDKFNNKIHFFIVEYGNDDMLYVDGYGEVTKSQIMQSLAGYFEEERLFRRSSVSMNVLVTKCDRIKDGDRMERVQEYIENSNWGSVVNGINNISVKARCGGVNVMGFSIGEVFAQDLCIFCPNDAEFIVSEIEERTHAYKDNWFSQLINSFRK